MKSWMVATSATMTTAGLLTLCDSETFALAARHRGFSYLALGNRKAVVSRRPNEVAANPMTAAPV